MKNSSFLDGQMLIAMPGMGDPRFDQSVIFMCAHSENGAMGIIVNKRAPMISFSELLERLDIMTGRERIKLPRRCAVDAGAIRRTGRAGARLRAAHVRLFFGRHVAADRRTRGADRDARHSARDRRRPGAAARLLALGYAGWGPGQLETRSSAMAGCTARPTRTCCSAAISTANIRALARSASIPSMLSADAGHA